MPETSAAAAITADQPSRNVIWRGDRPPPRTIQLGMLRIDLPEEAVQRAGFVSSLARRLVINVPGYKFFRPKG